MPRKMKVVDWCSFCGAKKSEDASLNLVNGPGVSICDQCNELARQSIWSKKSKAGTISSSRVQEQKAFLDDIETEELKAGFALLERVKKDQVRQQQMYVDTLRAREVSWAEIGECIGLSRQAVWQRFGATD